MNRYEALKHAVKAHAGQVDKCGNDYVLHPIAVAELIASEVRNEGFPEDGCLWIYGHQEQAEVVALLHDVWEDTAYELPLDDLGPQQREALWAITKSGGDTYAEYLNHVASDRVASIVKLADLWHNLQPERQACLPSKEQASLEKRYLKARERIWEALGYEWWPEGVE